MRLGLCIGAASLGAIVIAALTARVGYAPLPDRGSLLNPDQVPLEQAYDVLGQAIERREADKLMVTPEGRRFLSPGSGAIAVSDDMVREGRRAFYQETYGNEVFLTDVLGIINGGLRLSDVAAAIVRLGGHGTDDLQVPIAQTMTIGTKTYAQGTLISTGLDVPKGGLFPLGIKLIYDRGHVQVGITCALCHATVDTQTGKVVEGAPNNNLNVGFLLAISSNPAAYFMHTGLANLQPFETDAARTVKTSRGTNERLPNPKTFDPAVRKMLASWPPGNFDSSPDLVNNPASIPSSFTAQGWPYGWSGHAAIGPFHGLTALNNNVHTLNSDELALSGSAPSLFGLDPEIYLGILMQESADPAFRYEPHGIRKPSDVLAAVDPTPEEPGVNSYAVLPTYPRANYFTTSSLIATLPDEDVGHSINAMSPFQNSLRPPVSGLAMT